MVMAILASGSKCSCSYSEPSFLTLYNGILCTPPCYDAAGSSSPAWHKVALRVSCLLDGALTRQLSGPGTWHLAEPVAVLPFNNTSRLSPAYQDGFSPSTLASFSVLCLSDSDSNLSVRVQVLPLLKAFTLRYIPSFFWSLSQYTLPKQDDAYQSHDTCCSWLTCPGTFRQNVDCLADLLSFDSPGR